MLEAASAATWALALYGGPRATLVSSGVVKELVAALAKAQAWRTVALARGGAAADAAVAAQQREAAAAQEELDTAAAAAAKAEEEEAGKRSDGPDLDAAVAAADAAADAALRQPLPDVTSISLSDCYAPPAGEVSLSTANRLAYNCLGALGVLVGPRPTGCPLWDVGFKIAVLTAADAAGLMRAGCCTWCCLALFSSPPRTSSPHCPHRTGCGFQGTCRVLGGRPPADFPHHRSFH